MRSSSVLLTAPPGSRACYVLAHGAGAGMTHPFMSAVANGLAERRIATLRYQFPYMDRGSKRPDPPKIAHGAVREAVAEARHRLLDLPIYAGGKSFGGRMTSQAQSETPLEGVRGLIFLGYPLHPPGRPANERAAHLDAISIPMLFLQGTRDDLARPELMRPMVQRLGPRATLIELADADHSFHVPKRAGRSDAEVMAEMLDALAGWINSTSENGGTPAAGSPKMPA